MQGESAMGASMTGVAFWSTFRYKLSEDIRFVQGKLPYQTLVLAGPGQAFCKHRFSHSIELRVLGGPCKSRSGSGDPGAPEA